jgi:hypothetical protein
MPLQSGLVTFSSKIANFEKNNKVNIHQNLIIILLQEEKILDEIVSNLLNDYNLSFDNNLLLILKNLKLFSITQI